MRTHRIGSVLAFAITALLVLGVQAEPEKRNNKFNVLFIAVDDLRPELGCYGVDYVKTPNIDSLARGSIVFRQHFVSVPTCGSSRYALLTGRSPMISGVKGGQNNALYSGPAALKQQQQAGAQSMPELFRRSGYHTVLIGKISHTPDGKVFEYNGKGDGRSELPNAWDEYATPYGTWKRGWGTFFAYADGKHREDGGGHRDLLQFTAGKDNDLPDGLMVDTAVAKLKELKKQNKPFFMGLGLYKPHLPFVAPKQDRDAVAEWDVPPPVLREGMTSKYINKKSGEFYQYTMPWEKSRPLGLEDAQEARRAYLACVRYIDRQIGKILVALALEGLADNTVVVLWGDHGFFLGEGAQWGKHTVLEDALHTPLIIRAPGVAPGDSLALASTVDIYPTLLDLCKPTFTKTAYPLDGFSLMPILNGQQTSVRQVALSTWGNAISYRMQSLRFIFEDKGGEKTNMELYDMRDKAKSYANIAEQEPDLLRGVLEQVDVWEDAVKTRLEQRERGQ
ncbi:MAG: sulfatase [Planctomycetota bacterium]